MTKTFDVKVVQVVRVILDETKFTPGLLAEYWKRFGLFETIEQHVTDLAVQYSGGCIDNGDFAEGLGPLDELGVHMEIVMLARGEPEEVESAQ